jgi:hypothetical protein
MNQAKRARRRDLRDRMKAVAYVFIVLPVVAVIFEADRYTPAQVGFMMAIGGLMLLWFRLRPAPPKHVAVVEFVQRANDYDGPDALTEPFYAAICDCGWWGHEHRDEASARHDGLGHTPHVLDGLRGQGD